MTFYYSMKQMLRSPLKSFLFFLLMGVSAFFLALGGNLWNMSRTAIQEFEKIFTTIGTVEQETKDNGVYGIWDAKMKEYQYFNARTAGERIKEEVLDFEGAGYVHKPRQRPYFGAYVEELYQGVGRTWLLTVEATPLKTETADHSVKMRIVKVLEGAVNEGDYIYVCEHQNPEPRTFEAGKTYIMQLNQYGFTHGVETENSDSGEMEIEYVPSNGTLSTQYTLDGERIYDPINESNEFDEVTEGFYETERGKRWLLAGNMQDYLDHAIPVQPTDSTKLLMPFYQEEVVITEGRDITEEEYQDGAKVCLIPSTLAMLLQKSVGGKLTLPLFYANYRDAPVDNFSTKGSGYGFSFINAQGQPYSVFSEQEYEIAGIYTIKDYGTGSLGIGMYEVVIPWNAVPENSWKDNIVAYGRMQVGNTSFQIPNGTIQQYQELWEKQGVKDLKITFYDKGYTQLREGIEKRKMMSWIFLVSGGVMALMILLFFSSMFITGQQERIAVERLLGRTKGQCSRSILTGILVLAAAGSILGSIAGWKATGAAAKKADAATVFDTSYSNVTTNDTEADIEWASPSIALSVGTGGGLILAAFIISSCYMKENLKKEPLQLLGKIEDV